MLRVYCSTLRHPPFLLPSLLACLSTLPACRLQSKNFFGVLDDDDSGDEKQQPAVAVAPAKKKAPTAGEKPKESYVLL
jgi:hypothetical protein